MVEMRSTEVASRPRIVACIPAFNEERTIAKIVIGSMKHVDTVIVCNDGSNDMTGEIARRLGAVVVNHERNMGYGAALATLFSTARERGASIAVTLDGDGQHDPDEIPKILEPILTKSADIVTTTRFGGVARGRISGVPTSRAFGIRLITSLSKLLTKGDTSDAQSGLRAYSIKALEQIRISEQGMGASTEILIKAAEQNLKLTELSTTISYKNGKKRRNIVWQGTDVILSMFKHLSLRHPLLTYGVPGMLCMILSSVLWGITIHSFATTRTVISTLVLLAIGTTLSGLVLITTSIIIWIMISIIRERASAL